MHFKADYLDLAEEIIKIHQDKISKLKDGECRESKADTEMLHSSSHSRCGPRRGGVTAGGWENAQEEEVISKPD